MKLTPGSRWQSAVCDTQVVLVKVPKEAGELQCGGNAMLGVGGQRDAAATPSAGMDGGTLLGKRYADDAVGIEVLCTKAGKGTLGFNGTALALREVTRLPSSD